MRQGARHTLQAPILVGDAHTFGVGQWVPGKRGRGTLTLNEAGLVFEPAFGGRNLNIPLADISEMAVTTRLPQSRVLVVTYHGNLVLGLTLEEPETWANAIQVLTGIKRESPAAGAARLTRFEIRRFRLAVLLLLLVMVVLSTAVPLFFSWMNHKMNGPPEGPQLEDAFNY